MMLMLPPPPRVADPVLSVIIPVLPADEVPVENASEPLTPVSPAAAVRILKAPLELILP
jgi:hypothetical protein